MPIYEYSCPAGHTHERLRKTEHRDLDVACLECGEQAVRVISAHHAEVDGIYSYAPNIGNPEDFERRTADADARAERTGTWKP